MYMNTTSNTTDQTTTHNDDCFSLHYTGKGLDLGCTCNWTEQDQHDLETWTN